MHYFHLTGGILRKLCKKGLYKKSHQKAGCAKRYSLQSIYRKTAGSVEEPAVWCYNLTAMKNTNTKMYYTPIRLKFPLGFEKIIKIDDPVYTFSEVMAHIDLQKYFVKKGNEMGRPRYDREKLLKIVLFAFMEFGYCPVRFIQKLCETDIRFLWILDGEKAPCHMTISNFIDNELKLSLDEVFHDIISYMFKKLHVDLKHVYIDGTKIEANANKYTWVWKKSCIKSRNNVFIKLSALLEEMNKDMAVCCKAVFDIRQEYAIEYVDYILKTYLDAVGMTTEDFVHGSGKRKTSQQKLYEKFCDCYKKLKSYTKKISICGKKRNSYSKTDNDATFMRFKKDHMKNDQLLPGYNLQMVICDEMIAHFDVFAFASDMDCFQPLMDGFNIRYGFYPQYPVADAGYGSFNNYLYCEQHGSIQAEGAFGGIKWNKGYRRLRRRGIEGVILESGLISCGFNLYKYHLKMLAKRKEEKKAA